MLKIIPCRVSHNWPNQLGNPCRTWKEDSKLRSKEGSLCLQAVVRESIWCKNCNSSPRRNLWDEARSDYALVDWLFVVRLVIGPLQERSGTYTRALVSEEQSRSPHESSQRLCITHHYFGYNRGVELWLGEPSRIVWYWISLVQAY